MISQDPKPGPFLEGARHFERGHENWSFYGVKIRGPSRLKLDFFTRDWARFITSMYLMYIVGKLLGKRYIVVLYFLSLFWPRRVNGPKFGLNHGQSCIINSHVWLTHHTAVYRNWAVLFWDYNFTITNLVLLIFFHVFAESWYQWGWLHISWWILSNTSRTWNWLYPRGNLTNHANCRYVYVVS